MARLIFLTGTPPNVEGGSGTWVAISVLRDAIAAEGHEVIVVAPRPRDGRPTTWSRLLFNLRVRRRLSSLAADVLVGFDLDGVFAPRGSYVHVAAVKGVRADEAAHERGVGRLMLGLQAILEGWHVGHADRVVTTSAYSARRIAELYRVGRSRIAVVPELIDLTGWQAALAEVPLEEGRPRILAVAHLYARKGVDVLLRAFALLKTEAVLHLAGIGPERERLESLATDLGIATRVRFLGHVSRAALIAEYRNATLFALPTTQEGFGIVFLEAMASGLPIVAARAAAVPEVVGESALLVEPDDIAGFAAAIERLLGDAALRSSLAGAGHERVRNYDAPVVARSFLEASGIKACSHPVEIAADGGHRNVARDGPSPLAASNGDGGGHGADQ